MRDSPGLRDITRSLLNWEASLASLLILSAPGSTTTLAAALIYNGLLWKLMERSLIYSRLVYRLIYNISEESATH
jgi:hypothetical protein